MNSGEASGRLWESWLYVVTHIVHVRHTVEVEVSPSQVLIPQFEHPKVLLERVGLRGFPLCIVHQPLKEGLEFGCVCVPQGFVAVFMHLLVTVTAGHQRCLHDSQWVISPHRCHQLLMPFKANTVDSALGLSWRPCCCIRLLKAV